MKLGGEEEREVIRAIEECKARGLVEERILATRVLTTQLNLNDSRSREWRAGWVGQVMAKLGFRATVTRIGYFRGWRVEGQPVVATMSPQ